MRRHWQYFKYVLRHKWYVFQECIKLGVPLWIAVFHDWDKSLPDEWFPYARCFYASNGTKQYKEDTSFTLAWNLHQKRNKHHLQWWVIMFDRGEFETIPMPDVYRREMLADWRGAGKAITGIGPKSTRLIKPLLSTFLTVLFHPANKLNQVKCIKNFYIIIL